MPRRARHYLAGMPYHIVQRGNNRQVCFREAEDFRCYLNLWRKISASYGACVHAYCLMTNHIHFLVTPIRQDSISNTTRIVGSRFAHFINTKYERTGTLWEGRHRASLVQTARYFLTCQRYIELNPVRAGMVNTPEDYRWSSFAENALGAQGWLTPHPDFLALADTDAARRRAYWELFGHNISDEDLEHIRRATAYCQPVATDDFKEKLKTNYGLKIGQMRRGKPKAKGDGGI
jgi:putative transposase